jgi:hypothetical protein
MRASGYSLLLLALTTVAGCTWGQQFRPGAAAPAIKMPDTTAAGLVSYLNRNAEQFRTLQIRDLDLDCAVKDPKGETQKVSLGGSMCCAKPKSFRLFGKMVGINEVDLGSNDQEFWYWIKRHDPPFLFHCSYNDLNNPTKQVAMPFPFQPEWVLEALGMLPMNEQGDYALETKPDTYELVQMAQSAQGQPIRKVIVFSRWNIDRTKTPDKPQVLAYQLQDAQGKVLCKASIEKVQVEKTTGIVFPHKLKLEWPVEKLELKMVLGGAEVNVNYTPERTAALFQRPHWNNLRSYDLARGLDAQPTGLQRTGGYRGSSRE